MAGSLQALIFVIIVIVLIAICQLFYWFFDDTDRRDEERGQWWSDRGTAENGGEGEPSARETRDTLPLAYSGPG